MLTILLCKRLSDSEEQRALYHALVLLPKISPPRVKGSEKADARSQTPAISTITHSKPDTMRGKMPQPLKFLEHRGGMEPVDLLWCQCNVHPVLSCRAALIRCPFAARALCDPPTCTSTPLFARILGTVTPSTLCLAAPGTQHSRKLLWSAHLGFQLAAVLQCTFFALRSACFMAVHAKIGLKMALQGRPQCTRFPRFYYGLLPALEGGSLAAQADVHMLTVHAH